jgi:hypothetical protein
MSDEGPHQDDLNPAGNGAAPTERVVLRLNGDLDENGQSWEVIGLARHSDKAGAIKQVAGDKPGRYRAPSLRAWRGGLEIVIPDKPKLEQKAFE